MANKGWNKETNRPDDWGKLLDDIRFHCGNSIEDKIGKLEYHHLSLVEAGADAIVEPAKAEGRRELIEWGDEICMEHGMRKRRRCDKCWQQLLKGG